MEYGVYLESSVVGLNPKVLNFLTLLIEKAREVKDFAIFFKKKELAEFVGKDNRTVYRYMKELEDRHIIQTRGVRGRYGGTVVMFNRKLIRFETSDKAFINSDKPISIDDIVKQKMPKKTKPPKEKKRNRRTKKQMLEDEILKGERQAKIDKLNAKLYNLYGYPNWEWFKETEDPVGNYRTYLISRLYNRYALLFVEQQNKEVKEYGEGKLLKPISKGYDVLPHNFYGSSRWMQFEKFRIFCFENNIDPAAYLSAQFNRSVYTASMTGKDSKKLPFVNCLTSDSSYAVYKQYGSLKKKIGSTYASFSEAPKQFSGDLIVSAISEALYSADSQTGMLKYVNVIRDYLQGSGASEREKLMVHYYREVCYRLHEKGVSYKTRNTIKKFVMMQSLIQLGGIKRLPSYVILGAEHTQAVLSSVRSKVKDFDKTVVTMGKILGKLTHPEFQGDKQTVSGLKFFNQLRSQDGIVQLLQLINEREGMSLTVKDINEAIREFGKEEVPVDDWSMLDVDQIVKVMDKAVVREPEKEIDMEAITRKRPYDLIGTITPPSPVDLLIEKELGHLS